MRWFLTPHALTRCQEMHLDRQGVVDIIENADVTWEKKDGDKVWVKGEYAVVTNKEYVLTVLWHLDDEYDRPRSHVDVKANKYV